MKKQKLSQLFSQTAEQNNMIDIQDKHGFFFSWSRKPDDYQKNQKVIYSIGCSWMKSNLWLRTVDHHLPGYLHINRAVGGQSNFEIIQTLQSDLDIILKLDSDPCFVISLTEPLRCFSELKYLEPTNYTNASDYLKDILLYEYQTVENILQNHRHYITTSFVPNYSNDNPTLMSYCKPIIKQPADCFNVGSGIYQWFADRKKLFKFDINNDLDKVIDWRKFMQNHQHMADHYHPNHYSVYENFLESIAETIDF